MSEAIWDKKIEKKIRLDYLSGSDIDIILALWDRNTLKINQDALINLSENPLYPFLKNNRNSLPVRSVLQSVRGHFQVFGIIESPYLDLEFWDSHTGFYAYNFSQYKIECKRIHFFSGDERHAKRLIELLYCGRCKHEIEKDLDLSWRGYSILRPIHSFVVGRTAIEFDETAADEMPKQVEILDEEKGSKPYLKARQYCCANLLNAHYVINTSEFIQQDPNLGHCATASLWVATKLMAGRFGTHRFKYRAITKQALGQWNREIESNISYNSLPPDGGITISEIKNAIAATGANTLSFLRRPGYSYENSFASLSHDIYSFMESNFPVLLCISSLKNDSAHVVAVVGHALPKVTNLNDYISASSILPLESRNNKSENHFLVGNIVNVYYVHDDAYGPFNRVIIPNTKKNVQEKQAAEEKRKQRTIFQCGEKSQKEKKEPILLKIGRKKEEFCLEQILVPVEPTIKSSASSIFVDVINIFNNHFDFDSNYKYLWRAVLLEGSEFKQSICRRGYAISLRKWYAMLHLPKYVWLFEVTIIPSKEETEKYFYHPGYKSRPIDGEFLYDATIPLTETRMISARILSFYTDYSKRLEFLDTGETIRRYNCCEYSCNDVLNSQSLAEKGTCDDCMEAQEE